MTRRQGAWLCGFATALAEMHRRLLGGNDSASVRSVASAAGLTLTSARNAGVSLFDVREQKQRQWRKAKERVWSTQRELAERQVDLVSYERVLADMERSLSLSSSNAAIVAVRACRDAVQSDCERLTKKTADLGQEAAVLKPKTK